MVVRLADEPLCSNRLASAATSRCPSESTVSAGHWCSRSTRAATGFAALSEQHGGGFIVEADRLREKFANCKIKTRKEDGQTLNIIAGCATDIMLSNVQFSLKVLEPNKISRTFPGMQDMEISYYRCPI